MDAGISSTRHFDHAMIHLRKRPGKKVVYLH